MSIAWTITRHHLGAPPPLVWMGVGLLGVGIALLPLPLALMAAASLPAILLIRWPALGLCVLALSIPFGLVYQFPALGGQIGLPEVVLAATLFVWLLDSLAFRRRPLRPDTYSLALGLFAWVVGLSLLSATSLLDGLAEVIKWTEVWLLYVVARALLTPAWRTLLIVSTLAVATLQAILGLYQFVFAAGPDAFRVGPFVRAYGTFAQPNPFAGYLGLVAPLALSLTWWVVAAWWQERSARCMILAATLAGITAVIAGGIVASWSRGALLGFAVAVLVVVAIRSKPALLAFTILAIAFALAYSTGIGADRLQPFVSRFTDSLAYVGADIRTVEITNENFAVIERAAHWLAGIDMFAEHPWLGVGAGNYPVAYGRYALPRWEDPLGHAHNTYINTAAETGIIGLLALFLVLSGAFLMAWQSYRTQSGYAKAVALGVIGILTHLTVHSLFDSLFVQRMYLHLALALAMLNVGAEHQEQSRSECTAIARPSVPVC